MSDGLEVNISHRHVNVMNESTNQAVRMRSLIWALLLALAYKAPFRVSGLICLSVFLAFVDIRVWCFGGWCLVVGERVQYEGDVRHYGFSAGRNGHIRPYRWGRGGDGASFLWLLWDNEARTLCSRICK